MTRLARGRGQRSHAHMRSGGGRGCATPGKRGPQLSAGSCARQRSQVHGGAGNHASRYPPVDADGFLRYCGFFLPRSRADVVCLRENRLLNFSLSLFIRLP